MTEDLRPSLEGRAWYQHDIDVLDRFWRHFPPPPSQNTVVIYNDGHTWEKAEFTSGELTAPDVHTVIYGGSDFRAEPGSFEYEALTAHGYWWRDNGGGGGVDRPEPPEG